MPISRRATIAAALAAALGSGATTAAAQEGEPEQAPPNEQNAEQDMQGGGMTEERELNDQAARQHFRVASRYYDEGRFLDAAEQFEEAYELSSRPELLYNAYIAYREASASARAATMLEAYLEERPDAPDRQNLEARLAELQRAVEEEERQRRELEEAERRAREAAQARQRAEAAPEAWPWVVLGVGGAAAIAGAVVGALALSEAGALRADCNEMGLCPTGVDLEERRDTAQTLALTGDLLLFGGGAVAVAGLVLGLVFGLPGGQDEAAEADEGLDVSLGCGATGCAGTLRGRF